VKAKLCNTKGNDNDEKELFFTLQILCVLNYPEVKNTAAKL